MNAAIRKHLKKQQKDGLYNPIPHKGTPEYHTMMSDFIDQLHNEIVNEVSITKSLYGISQYEDDVNITFETSISGPEKIILDKFNNLLGSNMKIEMDYVDDISRELSGKYKYVHSMISPFK